MRDVNCGGGDQEPDISVRISDCLRRVLMNEAVRFGVISKSPLGDDARGFGELAEKG
jgi:hypothetical protein